MATRVRYSSGQASIVSSVPSYSTSNLRAYQTSEGGLKISTSRSSSPILSSSLLSSRRYVSSDPAPAPSTLASALASRLGAPRKEGEEEAWKRPDAMSMLEKHNKEKEKIAKEREDSDFIAKEKERLSRERSASPALPSMAGVAGVAGVRSYTRTDSTSTSSPTRTTKRPEYYSSGLTTHKHSSIKTEFCFSIISSNHHSTLELKLPTYEAASRFLSSAPSLPHKPLSR